MVDKIDFDSARHIYSIDGKQYPSVTTVLQETGINDMSNINPEILQKASNFGLAVHKLLELSIKGTLDITSVDEPLKPYMAHWNDFVMNHKVEVINSELMLVDKSLQFAGTIDVVAKVNGALSLIDFKTSTMILPHYYLQTAGYKILAIANGIDIVNRYILKLEPDKYKVEWCKAEVYDRSMFTSVLNIWHYKKKNQKYFEGKGGYVYANI